MRTCEGQGCHSPGLAARDLRIEGGKKATRGRNICGKCCVEVGVEGRVWCLVCFEDDADAEHDSQSSRKDETDGERSERVKDWLNECGQDA